MKAPSFMRLVVLLVLSAGAATPAQEFPRLQGPYLGEDDLYISFRDRDGTWGPPVVLGPDVNSSGSENRPWVSRDGRYFFFTSTRNGSRDAFWVKAAYLERFRR
jgi:hypothetical protein